MFSSEMSKYHFIFLTSPIKETNQAKCYYLLSVGMNMWEDFIPFYILFCILF